MKRNEVAEATDEGKRRKLLDRLVELQQEQRQAREEIDMLEIAAPARDAEQAAPVCSGIACDGESMALIRPGTSMEHTRSEAAAPDGLSGSSSTRSTFVSTSQTERPQVDCSAELLTLLKRTVHSLELPKFNGDERDWHRFIARYESSTKACSLTADENLTRLDNCLSGEARKIVKNHLLRPEGVDKAIEILRLTYGSPVVQMRRILRDVKKLPYIKSSLSNLDAFVNEANSIATDVDATENVAISTAAIVEATGRLPLALAAQWAQIEGRNCNSGFSELIRWLEQMMTNARRGGYVTADGETVDRERSRKKGDSSRHDVGRSARSKDSWRNDEKHPSFAVLAVNKKEVDVKTDAPKNCELGCDSAHELRDCEKYRRMNAEERRAALVKLRRCFACTGRHMRIQCDFAIQK